MTQQAGVPTRNSDSGNWGNGKDAEGSTRKHANIQTSRLETGVPRSNPVYTVRLLQLQVIERFLCHLLY